MSTKLNFTISLIENKIIYIYIYLYIYTYIYMCVCVCVCVCVCDTICSIRFGGCGCQSKDHFVLMRNPHKGLGCEMSHETRRGWGKEGVRLEQKKQRENRSEESADQGGRQKRAGARACGLRGRVSQHE